MIRRIKDREELLKISPNISIGTSKTYRKSNLQQNQKKVKISRNTKGHSFKLIRRWTNHLKIVKEETNLNYTKIYHSSPERAYK